MRALPRTPELLRVARRVIWFEGPERALADPLQFLAHVMVFGTVEDLKALPRNRRQGRLSRSAGRGPAGDFRRTILGLLDLVCDRQPTPPLPIRTLPPTRPMPR
jgi:hypothetical protein